MKSLIHRLALRCLCLMLMPPPATFAAAEHLVESSLEFGRFGKVHLYAPATEPEQVVLFISGDGGWNLGVVDMARSLVGLDALVVGIDIRHYLKALASSRDPCAYPAADFEALGQFAQKKLGYRHFHRPVLLGYSSGATLAYATLAQAPKGTFAGALSLGFCPDLLLRKPLCKGDGLSFRTDPKLGQIYAPVASLDDPWVVLHGDQDQVCSLRTASEFVGKIEGARLVRLPKVGHGFSVQRNWLPQFKEAFTRLIGSKAKAGPPAASSPPTQRMNDLPLVEVAARQAGDALAVVLSGDGGWAGLDKELSAALAARGIAVIGWDSLRYYWSPRTPDEAAADLASLLAHYRATLKRDRILLIGYSFGADVLPFLATRLPPELQKRVEKVVLLGPSPRAHFEFRLSDWLGGANDGLDSRAEVARMPHLPLLCVHGAEDRESLCPKLEAGPGRNLILPGGHHFDGDYTGLARLILETPAQAIQEVRVIK